MSDPTEAMGKEYVVQLNSDDEAIRRERIAQLNSGDADRVSLENQYGQVWDTSELQQNFEVKGFMAPLVVVVRKSDNVVGSLEFRHSPRFYFNFQPD